MKKAAGSSNLGFRWMSPVLRIIHSDAIDQAHANKLGLATKKLRNLSNKPKTHHESILQLKQLT